jgi:deoxyadenosine/deoxycytidine kinase
MKTDDPDINIPYRIGIVGPCTAGKSTLIKNLNLRGITARHIAQEHSYVQNMWQRLTNPDILIFLDVSYPVSLVRRNINWTIDEYLEQHRRLAHARANAHLYVSTDNLTEFEVAAAVLEFVTKYTPQQ